MINWLDECRFFIPKDPLKSLIDKEPIKIIECKPKSYWNGSYSVKPLGCDGTINLRPYAVCITKSEALTVVISRLEQAELELHKARKMLIKMSEAEKLIQQIIIAD